MIGRHDRARDRPARDRAAPRGLHRRLVRRVLHRLAAVQVGQRRHLGVDVDEPREPVDRVVGVGLERRAGQDPGLRRRAHAGAVRVDVGVAGDQVVVDVGLVHVQVDDDLGGQLLGVRVSGRVPVRVVHHDELLVQRVALEHVRAGGQRVQLVVAAGVGAGQDRGGVREREHVGQVRERGLQVEHQRGRVRGVDRGQAHQVLGPVLVRARVGRVGEQRLVVGRPVGQHRPVVGALDRVLHVLRGDDRAVLELDVRLDVERTGKPVVAGRAHVRGQVRHELSGRTSPGRTCSRTAAWCTGGRSRAPRRSTCCRGRRSPACP